jgi:hypothetical protein
MARLFSNRDRPFDMGVLPTELLARDAAAPVVHSRMPADVASPPESSIVPALREHLDFCLKYFDGEVAATRAPVPDDLVARARNLKASAYFLDATLAGACRIDDSDWLVAEHPRHTHAFVFLVEFGREPKAGEPGAEWIRGSNALRTDVRCAEVGVVLAGYIRLLGWPARAHVAADTLVAIERLAQRSGVAKDVNGTLKAPLMQHGFRLGVVTTSYEIACDLPLAALDWPSAEAYMGKPGTRPGWTEAEEAKRPLHLGRYEMERIKRVDEPTTLVLRDEIKRMPKRADLFTRALAGDLGAKLVAERRRFAVKHPLAFAMTPIIRNLVPLQGTRESRNRAGGEADNAKAVKALAYYLGVDLAGICRAEPWMYYSHDDEKGEPIDPYHPNAVVMLIDQGFDRRRHAEHGKALVVRPRDRRQGGGEAEGHQRARPRSRPHGEARRHAEARVLSARVAAARRHDVAHCRAHRSRGGAGGLRGGRIAARGEETRPNAKQLARIQHGW